MSSYSDEILAKIQREKMVKEEKDAQAARPFSMASSDDAEIDMDFDNIVSDSEFADDFFNDQSQGNKINDDTNEPESEIDEIDNLNELINREVKDKKKKKGLAGELEEQSQEERELAYIQKEEDAYAHLDDAVYNTAAPEYANDETVSDYYNNTSHVDIIDAIAQSETFEQHVNEFSQEITNNNVSVSENRDVTDYYTGELASAAEPSVYVEQSGSNVGFDTRSAVVDAVADEQIKSVTEAYTSPVETYVQEFNTSDVIDNSILNETKNETKSVDSEFTHSMQENDERDKTSDKEARLKSVVDDKVEQKETEVKQSDFKEQTLHQFSEAMNSAVKNLHTAGERVVSAVVHESISADKNSKAGVEELQKFIKPIEGAATIIGLAALAGTCSDEIKVLSKAGTNVDKLILEGKMSVDDLLLSKKELREHLKDAGVSSADRDLIVRNRNDIHDIAGVRSEMKSMVATGQMNVDEKTVGFLNSSKLFDMHDKQTGQLLNSYYKNSSDDTIRNVFGNGNFTGKSSATFRKFIKTMDKNEISANGQASIKMGKLASNLTNGNRVLSANINTKTKNSFQKMFSNVTACDSNSAVGLKTLTKGKKIASHSLKIGAKVLIGTRGHGYKGLATKSVRLVKKIMVGTKKSGYKGVATQIGRGVIRFSKFTDKSFYALTNHSIGHFVKTSRNSIRNGKNALKGKVNAAAQKAKNKALSTGVGRRAVKANATRINTTKAAIAKYKSSQQAARKLAQKLSQTKAAKAAAIAKKVFAKGTGLFIGTPLRFGAGIFRKIKLSIGKIFNAMAAIKRYLMWSAISLCITYVLLILIVTGLTAIFGQNNEAINTIILTERDEFVPESIARYLQKSVVINSNAVSIGEDDTLVKDVTSGHTINKYGHPASDGSWIQGYKIYYTDSNGNIVQDGKNNVKDAIILAYVQSEAEWASEYDATELMDKYFNWLNPNADKETMRNNSKESDIYFCEGGCETTYYTCNDDAILTNSSHTYISQAAISSDAANGTKFYGNIASNSNGDYYVNTCEGHIIVASNGLVTYAYHGSKTNGVPSGCTSYETKHYCTGHSVKSCYGHRDISIYIPVKTMQDAFDEGYRVDGGAWEEDDIDLCGSLYSADWYDLYGKDPDGGVGFVAGGSMTADEINAVLSNCGSVSEVRQSILASALSQVGSVPYYYGGKPISGDVPISTNRGMAGSTATAVDHIGRTIAGLDCFGFCQWAYWNATGSNILPEGSNAGTSKVYTANSYGNLTVLSGASELQIGDLGFQLGHVGIFAGVSDKGKLMWLHCNGGNGAQTVSYGVCNGFDRFYRLNGLD